MSGFVRHERGFFGDVGAKDWRKVVFLDAFNMEHSAQIAALNQDAESIRGELAKFSAANPQPADGQSAETLVRQFNDSVRDIEIEQPLFTHRP